MSRLPSSSSDLGEFSFSVAVLAAMETDLVASSFRLRFSESSPDLRCSLSSTSLDTRSPFTPGRTLVSVFDRVRARRGVRGDDELIAFPSFAFFSFFSSYHHDQRPGESPMVFDPLLGLYKLTRINPSPKRSSLSLVRFALPIHVVVEVAEH